MIEQQPKTTNPQTGMLVSHGHEYTDTPKMREMVRRANEIRIQLPLVPDGHTRLWRGNRAGEVGKNPSYTSSLEGIALTFLDGYGGQLSYIDIPDGDLGKYLQTGARAPDSEFILPPELVATVKIVGMTDQEAEELKKQSRPEESPKGAIGFGNPVG